MSWFLTLEHTHVKVVKHSRGGLGRSESGIKERIVAEDKYQIWCNGALWVGQFTLVEAFRRVADLADRPGIDTGRKEWVIKIVKM